MKDPTKQICEECGNEFLCTMKVTDGKPIYCRKCFKNLKKAGVDI